MLKIESKDSENSIDNLEYVEPEIWKEIEGYDGYYEISNYGNVRTWRNGRWGKMDSPKIMSLHKDRHGYLHTTLSTDGDTNLVYAHRLVGIYFVDNPLDKPCINHKDGIKDNNYYKNIEWVTISENTIHSYKNGLQVPKRGVNHPNNKLSDNDILDIRNAYRLGCFTQQDIADAYDLHVEYVGKIVRNKVRKLKLKSA